MASWLPLLHSLPFRCSLYDRSLPKQSTMMMLRAAPAFSIILNARRDNPGSFACASSFSSSPAISVAKICCNFSASAFNDNSRPLFGVVFEPFEEVKKELSHVPTAPQLSLARHKYADECELAINEQINVEYNVSYAYHAMYAYFDRDNVALRGLAKFFKESSLEERRHAEIFIEYQNKRGGKVQLQSIGMPRSEFNHEEKPDALCAMELALSLEKLTNEKLLNLNNIADRAKDPQLVDFIENVFLKEQVESIKQISEYVAQLRRVGDGHGAWHFDQMLLTGECVADNTAA